MSQSLFSSIKRLTRHTAVYGIGHIVSRFIGFLLLPIHTNVLAPAEYRSAALLFPFLAILNYFFSYGMDVAFLRFFIMEDERVKKERILSTAFWMIFGTGILFASLMAFYPYQFSNLIFRSNLYYRLIYLSSGILFFDALCLIPFLVLRAEERSISFVMLKSMNIVANLLLNILFVVILKKGVIGIFTSNLLASVFTFLLLMPVLFKWLKLTFSGSYLKKLLSFGLPYVPSGLSVIVMDQMGRFFIDRMIGKEAAGIFSANFKLGMIMALVVSGFRFAWHPYFLSTAKKEDNAPSIFARVLTYFLLITGFIYLGISIFTNEIVNFRLFGYGIIGREYTSGITIVPVVMLSYICYGIYVNLVVGIYIKNKTIFLPLVTGIGAVVSIMANLLLIPKLGIHGAAWASFSGYFVMMVSLYFINQILYPTPYEMKRIMKIFLIGALIFISETIIFDKSSVWIRLLILLSMFPLLMIVRFFNREESQRIIEWIRRR